MKILSVRTLMGPNVFHHKPVIILTINLEKLADTPSTEFPGLTLNLQNLLPGIKEHHCSPGYPGGFVERMQTGTYLGHIIEHIALELSIGANIPVSFGKTVYGGAHGIYQIAVRFENEEAMKFLLKKAVIIAQNLIDNQRTNIDEIIYEAKEIVRETSLGPSTKAIVDAAIKQHIPWRRLNEHNLIQLGFGRHRQLIQATTTTLTSDIAVDIAQDKELTKKILSEAMISVPRGKVADSKAEALELYEHFNHALTVKPLDGNQGRGVSLNITNLEDFSWACDRAFEHSSKIIIEEFINGSDYRLVIVGGKLVAASQRFPAHVVGDGKHTINELAEIENTNPMRGEGHSMPLTLIKMDDISLKFLAKQNVDINSVPAQYQVVHLRETANLSTGGSAIDVTDEVHPEIKMMCERAARLIGLDICGVDLIAEDISSSLAEQEAAIIEVNASPGIRMHHFPKLGRGRDVGKAIVQNMFPKNFQGRIPIVSITGTNGKTTLTRLISHVLTNADRNLNIGMTSTDGIYINNKKIVSGDTTGPASALAILGDPIIDIAVLETARGGLVRRGLAFDLSDVGIITNIEADHIGQDGIENLRDILRIKAIVPESVREGGTVILNGDDKNLVEYAKTAYRLKNKKIVLVSTKNEIPHYIKGLSFTFNGTADFHILNALMAYEACSALGFSHDVIMAGLNSFDHHRNNQGRTNFFKIKNGYLMLDYGHNPHALKSIGEMIAQWNVPKITGVIAAPGDRSNAMISLIGSTAASVFQRIIIRDDEDLRGRKIGEIPELLMRAVKHKNKNIECEIKLGATEAIESALGNMQDGEVVVFFYDELTPLLDYLKQHNVMETSWCASKFSLNELVN